MTRQTIGLVLLVTGTSLIFVTATTLAVNENWRSVPADEAATIIGAGPLCSDWTPSKCDNGGMPEEGCNLEQCKSPTGPNPNGTAPKEEAQDWCGEENSPCGKVSHNQKACNAG